MVDIQVLSGVVVYGMDKAVIPFGATKSVRGTVSMKTKKYMDVEWSLYTAAKFPIVYAWKPEKKKRQETSE